ncbi:cytochrome b5-like [Phymastichus coffea]|uniref:cytochrome b5-like n=1 Tax=Phymastichus coffea TaxID=108790 RepID=UPI00273B361C|nr:cytochrome b5-like [Phymastichus coffea]
MDERRYTLAEVGRNNGSDGCPVWIVLWGNVYDVTEYMDNVRMHRLRSSPTLIGAAQHPGGPELIAEHAGADASAGFDDFGHSSDARRTLRKYEIGALATEASPGSGGRGGATRRR